MQFQRDFIFVVTVTCIILGIKVFVDDLNIRSNVRHHEELQWGIGVNGENRQGTLQRRLENFVVNKEPRHHGNGVGAADVEPRARLSNSENRQAYGGRGISRESASQEPDAQSLEQASRNAINGTKLRQIPLPPDFQGDNTATRGSRVRKKHVLTNGTARSRVDDGTAQQHSVVKSNFRNLPETVYKLAPQIFDGVPKRFLPEFKDPCWRTPSSVGGAVEAGTATLQCLPYFFLAGMPKCGTTDLHVKLHMHPQMIKTKVKEPHWWTRHRFNGESLWRYLEMESINIAPRLEKGADPSIIIGDSSASTFWDNSRWRQFFPNTDVGPPHTLAEIIGTVLPDAKIIVIFRNPVDRLYSDFNYFNSYGYGQGPSIFHAHVTQFLKRFQSCLKNVSDFRTCTYDFQSATKTRISIGMYATYLRDWLKVFTRDQIRVLRLEDWHTDCTDVLPGLYEFLQLRKLDSGKISEICNQTASNANRRPSKPMLPETRQILTDFYQPSNHDLAEMLGDNRYLWKDDK